jgi:hypothetical protein
MKPLTIDTAPIDVLRRWLRDADAERLARHEHWRLGWWIATHTESVTLELKDGSTITAAPELLPRAIEQHTKHTATEAAKRAA